MTAGTPPVALHQVRASLLSELDLALRALASPQLSDEAVHKVRRTLKQARSALRLLRTVIGTATYRRDNVLLRDAARPLTPIRDSTVLLETLKSLADGKANGSVFIADLRRSLRLEHTRARAQLTRATRQRIVAALTHVRQGIESIPEDRLDRGNLRAGLERAYRSARKAYRRMCKHASDETLHECRKQTKYYLHQLELVSALDPKRFAKRRKRAEQLGDQLGDDHDLAVLADKILKYARAEHAASRDPLVEELLQRIATRRRRLERKAARLGQRLYADKARSIGRKAERTLSVSQARSPGSSMQ